MVFESIVADVLNKTLGTYFENLDASQLKIGIWGGDVVLRNLHIKKTALDDLELPFAISVGRLERLTLKIPWQHLYTAPVELDLQGLYLLVSPSQAVPYNEETEEKAIQAAKKKELDKIEAIRIREEKRLRGDLEPDADTFIEKMIAQIIKNVQIKIKSIHLRFEDEITNVRNPFSFGVILKSLDIVTTDTEWNPKIITETVNTFHKLAKLNELSLYWNSRTTIINVGDQTVMLNNLMQGIDDPKMAHVLGPIVSEAKLKFTPNPERGSAPFSLPKVLLNIIMDELALGMTRNQFQDIIMLIETIDYMQRALQYRKYRPLNVKSFKNNYKTWWKFAYQCVLEEDVRKRRRNWDWDHIKQHRNLCRIYSDAYYIKLTSKKLTSEIEMKLNHCEKILDIFNISLARQQAEVKVMRQKERILAEPNKGWFGGWFGGGAKQEPSKETSNIAQKFEEALTPDEKAKLYSAINYDENALPLDYPKEYVEYSLDFLLKNLKFVIRDDISESGIKGEIILDLQIPNVTTELSTRPVRNGLKISMNMGEIKALGYIENYITPVLLKSKTRRGFDNFVSITYEKHPLSSSVDQRIWAKAQPVEIVYDAKTVLQLYKCFTLPEKTQLSKLQAVAASRLNEWKEQSSAELQRLFEEKQEIEIDIVLLAPYILVPEKGTLHAKGSMLVINLGELHCRNQPRPVNPEKTKAVVHKNTASDWNPYDEYIVKLMDFEVSFALPGEDYAMTLMTPTDEPRPSLHLIKFKEFNVKLSQSLIPEDPRFPKLKVEAVLPLIDLNMSEEKLISIVTLFVTLPLPKPEAASEEDRAYSDTKLNELYNQAQAGKAIAALNLSSSEKPATKELVEFTEISIKFQIGSVKLELSKISHSELVPFMEVKVSRLEVDFKSKTFGMEIESFLGGITLLDLIYRAPSQEGYLQLIRTFKAEDSNTQLLRIDMFMVGDNCPASICGEVKQKIVANMSAVEVNLHLEAIKNLISVGDKIQQALTNILSLNTQVESVDNSASIRGKKESKDELGTSNELIKDKKKLSKIEDPNYVSLKIEAQLEALTVKICSSRNNIMNAAIGDLVLAYQEYLYKRIIKVELKKLNVVNLDATTIYKDVLRIESDKFIHASITMYNDETKGDNMFDVNKHDIIVSLTTGSPKIYYINSFLNDVLGFINAFQVAKEAVLDASAAAAVAAKENVEQAYASATRILLEINFKAPEIFVPVNKKSNSAIYFDFGSLKVKNSFRKLPVETKHPVITDNMLIILDNVQVLRVILDPETQNIKSYCLLLEPVNIKLSISRNLSPDYKDIPSTVIKGVLNSLTVKCSSEDYQMIMACIHQNIAAPEPIQSPPPIASPSKKSLTLSKIDYDKIHRRNTFTVEKKSASSTNKKESDDLLSVNLQMELEIVKISAILFEGASEMTEISTIVTRKTTDSFAHFWMENLKTTFKMSEQGFIDCDVILNNINLNDTRPGTRDINNLIRTKDLIEGVERKSEIIRVKFVSRGQDGSSAQIELNSLVIILNMDYMMKIVRFFGDSGVEKIEATKLAKPASEASLSQKSEVSIPDPESPSFKLYATMGDLEIILVETMETIDTKCLILNLGAYFKMINDERRQNILGTVSNLSLAACIFNPELRAKTRGDVLAPVSMTLVLNSSKESGTLADLNLSNIFIRLNAGTLEFALKVLESVSKSNNRTEESDDDKVYANEGIWTEIENERMDFWFLKPNALVEVGVDALSELDTESTQSEYLVRVNNYNAEGSKEKLVLESGTIIIHLEAGKGSHGAPLMLMECDTYLIMTDWSSKMGMSGRLNVQAACYNSSHGMWEYFIEPIGTRRNGKVALQPWELAFEYTTNITNLNKQGGRTLATDLDKNPQVSSATITLSSTDFLEITCTRSSLDCLTLFVEEYNGNDKSLLTNRSSYVAPYVIVNDCGCDVLLVIKNSSFILEKDHVFYDDVILKQNTSVKLGLQEEIDMTKHKTSVLREQEATTLRTLGLKIKDFNFFAEIPVNQAEKRFYKFPTDVDYQSGIIVDIVVKDASKVVTIRGFLQIINNLKIDVDIFCLDSSGNTIKMAGSVLKNTKYNIPVQYVNQKASELYFAPTGYNLSSTPYPWAVLMRDLQEKSYLTCKSKQANQETFTIKVIGEVKQALFEATNRKTLNSQCCYIYLKPPLIIDNLLPVQLGYFLDNNKALVHVADHGKSIHVTSAHEGGELDEFKINLILPSHEGKSWTASVDITNAMSELTFWEFKCEENPKKIINLGIHREFGEHSNLLHVYCPFWMINRTGKDLAYRAEDQHEYHHPASVEGPTLFSFRGSLFFSKNKASFRVNKMSDWSEKFPLDAAGSTGTMSCKSPTRTYEFGVAIELQSWGLTKAVIFTPKYYLTNQCSKGLKIYEMDINKEIRLEKNSCVPFWPKSPNPLLKASYVGSGEETNIFNYDTDYDALLKLPNKYGGLHVDIHISESSTHITFNDYLYGQAPALVINGTNDLFIEMLEKDVPVSKPRRILSPRHCMMLAWEEPTGHKTLQWSILDIGGKEIQGEDKLLEDAFGTFKWKKGGSGKEVEYFWISFLDGLQRVLFFTTDLELVSYLNTSKDSELHLLEVILHFHGLGLSLVDNEKGKELMYLRISSSGIHWETCKAKGKRFKPLPDEDGLVIERAYENFLNEKALTDKPRPVFTLDNGYEINFVEMKIKKPFDRELRRIHDTGIWVHYKVHPHTILLHAKIHKLQIDNQMPDAIFRTIFAPTASVKTLAQRDERKPFVELSVMKRLTAHSSVIQYKYFKILVQEFHVKLDITFVNATIEMFSASSEAKLDKMLENYAKDYTAACTSLEDYLSSQITSIGHKNFYDYLHFSPLKIHVSFSMGEGTALKNNFLNLLLQSFGVTLTEIEDVTFKLACLELQHKFLSADQLQTEAYNHYSSQIIKQIYVVVLGLDVIGNPYGLVLGVKDGVQAFFYEPLQGAIQGPGEFAEGLALGVKSLFGHTVGGAAGALSKITGTVGKGIAALTLDDEYQKRRRANINRKPADLTEGIARSGKGLVMGFVDGVTGVFTKPIKGAQSDGVEGFFKGFGKGVVGLAARPVGGIVDFASGSFDTVKRATSTIEDVYRMRPPRHVPLDTYLKPYIRHEAEGTLLLNDLEKGQYASTDTYVAHALVNPHGIYVLLLTDQRAFYLKRGDLFGGWKIEWTYLWDDFAGPPNLIQDGLSFKLKSPEVKSSFFKSNVKKDIIVPIFSADVCSWILGKIEMIYREHQNKPSLTTGAN